MFAGGLLGSAGAVRELADNAIAERQQIAGEQRAAQAHREAAWAAMDQKLAYAERLAQIEQQGRQASADAIAQRLDKNAETALAGRYAEPVMGATPLTPEQQAAMEQGLKLRDAAKARDKAAYLGDSRNRVVAAVDVGALGPISLAELDAKDEAAASRAASEAARLTATTDVALARIDAAQAKADAAAKEREQGKPPSGYRHTAEGNLEAIPGGPADLKQQGQFNADTATMNASFASFDRLAGAANELLNHPGLGGITGLRGKLPNIPGGDAANAQALLDTLKSQVAFGVLQDMRNNSKTGGALGAVSDAEGKRLEANLAALDRAQSVDAFRNSLRAIITYTDGAKDRMRESFNLRHGAGGGAGGSAGGGSGAGGSGGAGVTRINSPAELAALPAGAVFQAPDGSIRVKR